MEGRYGPYVTDGTTHATLPKSADPKAVTLEQAVAWIDAKAAKGPSAKGKKGAGAEEEVLAPAGPAVRVLAAGGSSASRGLPVEQEQASRRRPCRCRRSRGLPSARRNLPTVAVSAPSTPCSAQVSQSSAVERIADEAAVAGLVASQPRNSATWPWNCDCGGRNERDAEASQRVADHQPRREIVGAVDDQVMA